MLEFKTGDYCMVIWDNEKITFNKALNGLERKQSEGTLHEISGIVSQCVKLAKELGFSEEEIDGALDI